MTYYLLGPSVPSALILTSRLLADAGRTEAAVEGFELGVKRAIDAGNLPLALALEPGSQTRASLGIVGIGGVMSSLILTLVLIPIVYVWLAPHQVPQANTNIEDVPPAPPVSPQSVSSIKRATVG